MNENRPNSAADKRLSQGSLEISNLDQGWNIDQEDTSFRNAEVDKIHSVQQEGISRIEAFSRLFGRRHPVALALYACIFCVAISFALDQSTTAAYDVYATGAYNRQSYIATVEVAESIIIAVSKPFLAKVCDVFSRQTAYCGILLTYVVGYVIVAASPTAAAFCVGRVISATGQAGFDMVTDIVVGDLSPLEWRGFTSAMTSSPYLFLPIVGSKIQGSLCEGRSSTCWRWGYGMFCIIAPVLVAPIIFTLIYADTQAKKAGELSFASSRLETQRAKDAGTMQIKRADVGSRFRLLKQLLTEIDFIGLGLLALGFALILLPFGLAKQAKGGWSNSSMIAMIVIGFVVIGLFFFWDIKFAKYPLLNKRVWYNKTFICAVTIDIFYFISGNLRSTYYTTWVLLIKPWNLTDWGYFVATTTIGLTFFGILAGLYHRIFHRYKMLQIFGLSIRIIALGITYWAVGPHASTAALVLSQILNAAGGACSVVGTRVASQASVPHQDLASIIAQLSLWTKLGSSVGSAIASAMYTNTYTKNLLEEGLSIAEAKTFFDSTTKARNKFLWGTDKREGAIRAFTKTMRPMFLTGLCLAFVPLFAGLLMPNYYLGKTQNAVDGTSNGGEIIVDDPNLRQTDETPKSDNQGDMPLWKRLWRGI